MHETAELLAGAEVVQRHLGEVAALDGDDALMAVLVRPLIDSEREIAAAQKLVGRRRWVGAEQSLELFRLCPGVAAQRAGVGAVGEQHRHRAVALRLHAERAAELQRGGQRRGQRQRLAGEPGDRRVVGVPGQQRMRQRPEPHQAAAHGPAGQIERRHPAWHDNVGHRRTVAVEEGGGFGHHPNIGIDRRSGYRPLVPDVDDLIGQRAMRPEDAPPVAALIRAALAAQSVVTDPLPSALCFTEADVTESLRIDGGGVAELADGLAGPALWAEQDGGLYLGRLAVAPARRGRGIVKALVAAAEAAARGAPARTCI
jgi:GNAT superfamily N-acetyltransferase